MKRKVKVISIIIVVILMVGYGVFSSMQPLPVETISVYPTTSEVTFIETGVVVNTGDQIVYPLAAGQVKKILVKEGDRVSEGQVMASLDDTSLLLEVKQLESVKAGYEAQLAGARVSHDMEVASLKANRQDLIGRLNALKAEVGSAEQRDLEAFLVKQAKDIYDQGVEDLSKYDVMLENGYISQKTYNEFETLVAGYASNYEQSKVGASSGADYYSGMRASLNAQISSIDATLSKDTLTTTKAFYQSQIDSTMASIEALKNQATNYQITSPIAGEVNEVFIENVNRVDGLSPAFNVKGDGETHIEVKVNTRDIEVIHDGDQVRLILDRRTGDIELMGRISYIATKAQVEMSALGIEERKVLVSIEPESVENLRSGYDVDVAFIIYSGGDKLIVPNSALYKKDGKDMVMLIENGKTKETPVTLGYELTGETIVEDGFSEGAMVITDLDTDGLSPGKKAKSSNE